MEFHYNCANITLLYQNAVYENSGLFARMYCFADQFYIHSCDIQLTRMLMKILTHSLCQAEILNMKPLTSIILDFLYLKKSARKKSTMGKLAVSI